MFSARDQSDGMMRVLELQRIRSGLEKALPDLANYFVVDEILPILKIPAPGGSFLVISWVKEGRVSSWAVVVPTDAEPTALMPLTATACVPIAVREWAKL